ncbi:MAG: hypothetical protein KGM49_00470 [Sphingomonadales bacterium]|nr:hypothetical protein [Sphingomonadales bacterium]
MGISEIAAIIIAVATVSPKIARAFSLEWGGVTEVVRALAELLILPGATLLIGMAYPNSVPLFAAGVCAVALFVPAAYFSAVQSYNRRRVRTDDERHE